MPHPIHGQNLSEKITQVASTHKQQPRKWMERILLKSQWIRTCWIDPWGSDPTNARLVKVSVDKRTSSVYFFHERFFAWACLCVVDKFDTSFDVFSMKCWNPIPSKQIPLLGCHEAPCDSVHLWPQIYSRIEAVLRKNRLWPFKWLPTQKNLPHSGW